MALEAKSIITPSSEDGAFAARQLMIPDILLFCVFQS
jgi:hypothetical protein